MAISGVIKTSLKEEENFILNNVKLPLAVEWLRIFFYALFFLYSILIQVIQKDFININFWPVVYIFIALVMLARVGLNLVYGSTQPKLAQGLVFIIDMFFVLLVMGLLGSMHSLFLFILMLNIVMGSFVLGLAGALNISIITAAGFNLLYVAHPSFSIAAGVTQFYLFNGAFFATAILSGLLKEEVDELGEVIEEKREDIRSLSVINEMIVENMGSGVMMIDPGFKILQANRGAAKILSDISLKGKKLGEVLSALDVCFRKGEVQRDKRVNTKLEISHKTVTGDVMILEIIVTPLFGKRGVKEGYVILFQNITEAKNFERALRRQEKMAAIGQMAAGIAHEIRNPLASISGSIQLLSASKQFDNEEDKKLSSITIKEIDRLNHLIAEFLDFVRPDSMTKEPFELNKLIKDVIEVVKVNPKISDKVSVELSLVSEQSLLGSYDKLKQAVLNLVINAYEAMNKGGSLLQIKTQDEDSKIVLVIEDEGEGMSEETLNRLFTPFHTTKPKGTGLGLAISHKIFEAHDAEVSVDSEIGKGTRFTIKFPANSG